MQLSPDVALMQLCAVTAAVYAGAWRLARRGTPELRAVDTVVLSLATRNVAVCLCGWTGILNWPAVAAVSVALAAGMFWIGSMERTQAIDVEVKMSPGPLLLGCALLGYL